MTTTGGASTKRPVVLFAIPTLEIGGAERVFTTLLRYIDPQAFELRLAVGTLAGAAFLDDLPPHVDVIELGRGREKALALALLPELHSHPPQIVVSTIDHLNIALCAIRGLWPRGTSHVVRATSVQNLRRWPFRTGMRWLYPRADAVVFQSETMRAHYAALGVRSRRGLVVNNPVDREYVRSLARNCPDPPLPRCVGPRLIAVGRVVPVKGYDLLIRAMAAMRAKPCIDIIGEGDSGAMDSLRALAKSLGVDDRVRLLGAKPNPFPWVAAADGYVLCSRSEGFPNTVLEALTLGTPVVATPVAGLEHLLGGVPGCQLADSISAESLAEALDRFCAERPGRTSPDVVADFDAAAVARRYEALFHELLSRPNRR